MKKELNSIGRLELVLVRPYCVFIYEVRCVLVQSEDINDSIRRRRDAFFYASSLGLRRILSLLRETRSAGLVVHRQAFLLSISSTEDERISTLC